MRKTIAFASQGIGCLIGLFVFAWYISVMVMDRGQPHRGDNCPGYILGYTFDVKPSDVIDLLFGERRTLTCTGKRKVAGYYIIAQWERSP